MFIAGLSVDDSIQYFEDLARKAFAPRRVSAIPVFSRIQKILLSYLADSLYPPEGLETGLKEIFGETMSMFDCSYATAIGAKIALPVTTIADCSPCLFTNYQGPGIRSKDCGMSAVQMFYSSPSNHH